MYINIDFELLLADLHFCGGYLADSRNSWQRYNPKKSDIDKLFREYSCYEFMENYYDSEPACDDEEFKMYMDYIVTHKTDDEVTSLGLFNALVYMSDSKQKNKKRFSAQKHSASELKAAYQHIRQLREDYEENRIAFNNWQEPHFEGNWGATQKQVDKFAKAVFKEILQDNIDKKDRLWVLNISVNDLPKDYKFWNKKITNDICTIYYYGRDYLGVDYVWSMVKKDEKGRV